MKQNTKIKSYIFAAAVSLGALATASAQSANVAVPNPAETASTGLLGSRYTDVTYNYLHNESSAGPDHADGFAVGYNQPINPAFDLKLNYDWARANFASYRFKVQDLDIGTAAYANLSWGKPFVLAAVGWQWQSGGGYSDNSFRYQVGVGTEFQVAPAFVVTPFVTFVRATGFNDSEVDFGVKAAYRVAGNWDIIARVQYDAVRHGGDTAEYAIGAAYHF
jgi:hypothetical protein